MRELKTSQQQQPRPPKPKSPLDVRDSAEKETDQVLQVVPTKQTRGESAKPTKRPSTARNHPRAEPAENEAPSNSKSLNDKNEIDELKEQIKQKDTQI